jgi:hypothetical protein
MPEVKKYNLREKLAEADATYKGDPALVGSSGMTFAPYNNSTRTNMFTSHMNQFTNIDDPDFPFVFTGIENTVGRNSSGYKKLKSNIKVFRKVVKFEKLLPDKPYFYQLFYWDYTKERYDVIERREVVDLGQNFGYRVNNDYIDSLTEGQEVSTGERLFASRSYDDNMNYRYGVNLNVMYGFGPHEYEDAATIAESVHEKCVSTISSKSKWGWNDNDIPLNLYGDDDEYRPLPWIGEEVSGIVASARPLIIEQALHDFKHSNLRLVKDSDRSIYSTGGTVIDYEIFLNNPDMDRNVFTSQLWMLIDAQNRYWKQIQDVCNEIRNSGKDYSHDVDLLYDKSTKFLERNDNRKWHNGSSVFGNVEIRIHIMESAKLGNGGKFTARYGNKSVVARVLPDHLMPFAADGTRVQVILAMPAIPNRTTGFVMHEIHLTWIFRCARKAIANAKTLKEKENILWTLIKRLNNEQYEKFYSRYKGLSKAGKEKYMQAVVEKGIYTHQDMINEDESVFYKIKELQETLPYLKPDTLYVCRFGHVYRLYQQYYLGQMYMFPLKQTDKRGFSVRATGAINMKGLPERSYKNKRSEAPFSDTAIRFGEYEALTMLIGMLPEELVAMEGMYRSSPEASQDVTKAQFEKDCEGKFKDIYRSRPAEICNVYFRHLGIDPKFIDPDSTIGVIDARRMKEHVDSKGITYLCTDYEYHCMQLKERIRQEVLEEYPVITEEELNRLTEERYKDSPILSKEYDGHPVFSDEVVAEIEAREVSDTKEEATELVVEN